MKKIIVIGLLLVGLLFSGCGWTESSRHKEALAQEALNKQAVASVGMPAIKNFREKRLLKDIIELRDQSGLVTYTYIVAEMTGKLIFVGETLGYGIPAATQYTNPMKLVSDHSQATAIPQADPNGLYSPSSAEGTWIMLKDPNGKEVKPVYVEPRIIVSPFKLH
ncbi:MAG: hypothetical protein AB9917_02025 [Negativicutes bacterium]